MEIVINITLDKLNQHLIDVKISFRSPFENPILEMPAWTPGSYLIREYARLVRNLYVTNITGSPLETHKIKKNNWLIKTEENQQIVVTYEVYAFELTVRTSYLDNRKCLINPASVFMYIVNADRTRHTKGWQQIITISIPHRWELFTSLKSKDNYFIAKNYDELVDSPIASGSPDVILKQEYIYSFNSSEIPNTVVFIGDQSNENIEKFTADIQKIQDNAIEMFDELPYDRYVWLVFLTEKNAGGLEHKYSNASIIPRYIFSEPKRYAKVLSLEAHEHFHTYNIKRIRPKQLGPFDYNREVYTKLLWIAEGITSFYDNIILPRSELISREDYWKIFAEDLETYYKRPGRFIESLEDASFDAWIKFYRENENSVNSSISYYLKGGIIGLMLDLEIRKQSNWDKSLDTFFQQMYKEYQKNKSEGYNEGEIQQIIEQTTGTDLENFWKKYISGTDELDLDSYLNLIGMKLTKKTEEKVPFTGINFNATNEVASVLSNSPAEKAGIYAFDEIVALQGYKITKSNFNKMLQNFKADDEIEIHLFRDGKMLSTKLILEEPISDKITIEEIDEISDEHKQRQDSFFYNRSAESIEKSNEL